MNHRRTTIWHWIIKVCMGFSTKYPRSKLKVKILNKNGLPCSTRVLSSPGVINKNGLPCSTRVLSSPGVYFTDNLIRWIVSSVYIYVICRLGGPYGEKLWPRAWKCCPIEAACRGQFSRPRSQCFTIQTDPKGPITWRISARAEISARLTGLKLLKIKLSITWRGIQPGAQFSPGGKS